MRRKKPTAVARTFDMSLTERGKKITSMEEANFHSFRTTLEQARDIGAELAIAKDQCSSEKVKWFDWLSGINLSKQRAQRYMKISGSWTSLVAYSPSVTRMGVGGALKALASPKEEKPKKPRISGGGSANGPVNGQTNRAARVGQNPPKSFTFPDEKEDPEKEETLEDAIAAKNHAIEFFCRKLMKLVDEECPEDPWLTDMGRRDAAIQKFKDACTTLRNAKCVGPCPMCKGQACAKCHKTGRVNRYAMDQLVG